ncbi:hypothetical protein ABFS82_12G032100 [Erythranthe guttata]
MDCYENAMSMGRVVCPKPRRVGPSNFNNSSMPLRFHIRNDAMAFDSKPGIELLDSILRKEGYEAERCANASPPFFFGSPPCRAQNPVVQDSHFRVEKPTIIVSSSSDSSSLTSPNSQPPLRVEGFDCQSSHVFAVAYNPR